MCPEVADEAYPGEEASPTCDVVVHIICTNTNRNTNCDHSHESIWTASSTLLWHCLLNTVQGGSKF